MTRARFLLLAPLLLAGCYGYPPQRENAGQYRLGAMEQRYDLAFVSGRADPTPEGRTALAGLRPALRANTAAVLVADAPLADSRAALVSRALGRSVTVDTRTPFWLGRNEALLVLHQPGVVADACTGAGQPVGRNLWTLDDLQRLLPPGCANAMMLLEQAASQQDLLRGRPLEPGAAGPSARAADRYLRRNEERAAREAREPGAGETSLERDQGSAQAAVPAPALGVQPPASQVPLQQERPPVSASPAPR